MKNPTRKKNPAAVALGKRGGAAKTPKQNAARKQNAQLAGRPRRVCLHCGAPVVGGHVNRLLDQPSVCGPHGWRWQQRDGGATVEAIEREIIALQKYLSRLQRAAESSNARQPS